EAFEVGETSPLGGCDEHLYADALHDRVVELAIQRVERLLDQGLCLVETSFEQRPARTQRNCECDVPRVLELLRLTRIRIELFVPVSDRALLEEGSDRPDPRLEERLEVAHLVGKPDDLACRGELSRELVGPPQDPAQAR